MRQICRRAFMTLRHPMRATPRAYPALARLSSCGNAGQVTRGGAASYERDPNTSATILVKMRDPCDSQLQACKGPYHASYSMHRGHLERCVGHLHPHPKYRPGS